MGLCKGNEDALIALLEGEEDDKLLAHLATCTACRATLEALHSVDNRLHTLAAVYAQNAPEVDLVDAVLTRLEGVKAGERAAASMESIEPADIMAYVDGEMDESVRRQIERAAAADPALRLEIETVRSLHEDLLQAGEAAAGFSPQVNLVDSVMQAVNLAKAPEAKVVPFRARPKTPHRNEALVRPWQWLALAAAACFVFGLWFAADTLLSTPGPSPATRPMAAVPLNPPEQPKLAPAVHTAIEGENAPAVDGTEGSVDVEGEAAPSGPELAKKEMSLQDVINERRRMTQTHQGDFAKWASLTPDEARELLKKGGLKPGDIAALSQALPPEEAAKYLRDAVKQSPNDPYLRYMLAKALADSPNAAAEALAQLAEWSQRDPQNSLHQFMEARVRFGQGDNEGALNALTRGSALQRSSAYSLENARSQKDVLAMSGMSSDAAAYVAASTLGSTESADISNMSRSLIQQGRYYESIGDVDTAQQIYRAVEQLGVQLVQSAAVTNEQLAGYDIQMQALDALRQLYELLADPDNLNAIEEVYNSVKDGLGALMQMIGDLDNLLLNMPLNTTLDQVNQILQNGDAASKQ